MSSLFIKYGIMAQGGVNFENPDIVWAANGEATNESQHSYFCVVTGAGALRYTPVRDAVSSNIPKCFYDPSDPTRQYVYASFSTGYNYNFRRFAAVDGALIQQSSNRGINTKNYGTTMDGHFIGGQFENVYKIKMSTGNLVATWTLANISVDDVLVDNLGRVYVFYTLQTDYTRHLVRLNADLTLDSTYTAKTFTNTP